MEYLDQIIGFLIIFLVIFFPIIRRMLLAKAQKRAAQPHPPEIQKEMEAERQLREHVTRLPSPKPGPKISPQPPIVPERTVGKGFAFHSALEEYKKRTAIERRHLESRIKPKFKGSVVSNALAAEEKAPMKKVTRLKKIFSGPISLKKMVVLHEIFRKYEP